MRISITSSQYQYVKTTKPTNGLFNNDIGERYEIVEQIKTMPYFVLYCAIYLFILSLKAIIAGRQISQKNRAASQTAQFLFFVSRILLLL